MRHRDNGHAPGPGDDRFRELVETLDAIVWEADLASYRTTYVSRHAEDVLGFPVDRWLDEPDFWTEHLHPEDRVRATTRQLLALGRLEDHDLEYRMVAADGTVRWFRDHVRVLEGTGGRRPTLRGVMLDITERKQAEEALAANELRMRGLVQGLGAILWEGRIGSPVASFVSEGAREILGYDLEDWTSVANFWRDHLHPDDREGALAFAAAEIEAGRDHEYEYRMVAADGQEVWFRDVVNVVKDEEGTPRVLRGVMIDVTERKRAEAAIAASEARFRTIFASAGQGIGIVGPEGRVVEVNRAVETLLGRTAESIVSATASDYTHPEDAAAFQRQFQRLKAGEIDRYELEKRYFHTDGSTRFGSLTCTAVRGPAGDFQYAITIVEDVTERKALQTQLLHAQKLDAVGRLAGGIAHDFNNLLTALGGHAQFLLDALPEDDPLREEADVIRRIGERAAALTRQLLAFSRRQVLQPQVVDVAALVGELESMLRRLIGEHIELRCLRSPGLWPIAADPSQIEQVVVNLAVNARDAMPDGGVLSIELDGIEVSEEAEGGVEPGRYVRIAVADTGSGIDPEARDHVFEPFFTTKEPGKGVGLGLSTTYGVVEQSRGFIRFESEVGEGTRFEVYLPAVEETSPLLEEPGGSPEPAGGTETILLVEDEPVVREVVCEMLERQGYTVLLAGDGQEALEVSAGHDGEIDVLATDVVMPRMNGRELADRLVPLRPDLRVLFLSGHTTDAAVWEVDGERRAFLPKPFTATALDASLRGLLDGQEYEMSSSSDPSGSRK